MKKINLLLIACLSFLFIACDSEDDFEYESTARIAGRWQQALSVDSVVVTFENSKMKRYIYQRGTDNILSRVNYGKYKLRKYTAVPVIRSIEIERYNEESSWYTTDINYTLSGNRLTIQWSDGYDILTKIPD